MTTKYGSKAICLSNPLKLLHRVSWGGGGRVSQKAVGPLAPRRGGRRGWVVSRRTQKEVAPEALSDFQQGLVAAAGPDNHVPVFLQDDVGAVIKVEDRDGVELSRGAAGLGHRLRVDKVYLEHTQW